MATDLLDKAKLEDRCDIVSSQFPTEDVITDYEAIKYRSRKIHKATSLGNLEHRKVHIIFKDQEGLKRVHTTIWVQLGDHIILKERITLPVNRIVDIIH